MLMFYSSCFLTCCFLFHFKSCPLTQSNFLALLVSIATNLPPLSYVFKSVTKLLF